MLKLQKGWRKWLMIGFVVVLVALAVLVFSTGCSSKPATPTVTPLQALQADVGALESITDQLTISAAGSSNSVSILETWKAGIETWKASVNEKITNLETGGLPEANLSGIEARLTFLEIQYEGIINSGTPIPTPTPTGTVTPTPTPTATPTPLPTVNHPPVISNLEVSSIDATGKNWMVACTASDTDGDILSYNWAVTDGMVFVMSSNDMVIWSLATNNSWQSITCQVYDGHGGYDIEIKSVYYP